VPALSPQAPSRDRDGIRPGILIVDDEPAIRRLLQTALRQHGFFAVWTAADGRQAVEIYRRHRATIGIVLLDVQMPVLDGPRTLAVLQRINPRVCCCFMSGHAGAYTQADLQERGGLHVFAKPFRLTEIMTVLRKLAAVVAGI
jgi:two-component system cell cycle sensor histidine kinase/response regulator CckA